MTQTNELNKKYEQALIKGGKRMNYSKFTHDVEAMGYSVVNKVDRGALYVVNGEHERLISVELYSTNTVDSQFESFRDLEDMEREKLLDLAWRLAMTIPAERGEYVIDKLDHESLYE